MDFSRVKFHKVDTTNYNVYIDNNLIGSVINDKSKFDKGYWELKNNDIYEENCLTKMGGNSRVHGWRFWFSNKKSAVAKLFGGYLRGAKPLKKRS